MIDKLIRLIISALDREEDKVKLTTSPHGVAKIKKFEGFRGQAYQCSAGVWTIGYGSTRYKDDSEVKPGDSIFKDEATKLLEYKLRSTYEPIIHKLVKVELNQNQFDALVSFVYNIGEGQFARSTLLKKLNQKDYRGAAEEFGKWVNAGGERLQGLINRREQEKILFLS